MNPTLDTTATAAGHWIRALCRFASDEAISATTQIWELDITGVLGWDSGVRMGPLHLCDQARPFAPVSLVPQCSGQPNGSSYNVDYAWPSDLIALGRNVPPGSGHEKWRQIEGKSYYMPGEVCDPIGKESILSRSHPNRRVGQDFASIRLHFRILQCFSKGNHLQISRFFFLYGETFLAGIGYIINRAGSTTGLLAAE